MRNRGKSAIKFSALTGAVISIITWVVPAWAADASKSDLKEMQEIKLRYVADDIDPESFAGQPRYCYRAGEIYGRIEEALDSKLGLHGLIVISCPDVWIINLADKTGKHLLDQAKVSTVHMPILATRQQPFIDLEFGRELQFFKSRNIVGADGPTISGGKTTSYKFDGGPIQLELLVNSNSVPLKMLITSPRGKRTLEYLSYKTLPFSADKFIKPDNIAYSEAATTDLSTASDKQSRVTTTENDGSGNEESALSDSLFAAGASKKEFNTMGTKGSEEPLSEPKAALTALNNGKDLWQWMTYYYLFPTPDLVPAGVHLLEKEGALDKESAIAPSASFLSRLFVQHPDRMKKWLEDINDLTTDHKSALLPLALRLTRTPEALAEAEMVEKNIPARDRTITHANLAADKLDTFFISAPSDLDMLWGCFFATGDKRYVRKIISTVSWSKKLSGNINKISIGAAAVWSLTSNAEQHKLVMQILQEESKSQPELRVDLEKIMEKAKAETST